MRSGKPSRTALKVAMNVVSLGAKPGMEQVLPDGIVEATARLLVASGAASATAVRLAGSRRMVSLYGTIDWLMPGQFVAFAQRKAFYERQVRGAIAAGAAQVLVLGAGYDTLTWRLAPDFPGVRFFEIDHPATARLKAAGIQSLGARPNLTLIAADLGQERLETVLTADPSWDSDARTVAVAEGLVMYLPEASVEGLFRQLRAASGPDSRVAFSFIPAGGDGRLDAGRLTGFLLRLQRLIGEPWLWSIRPRDLAAFLESVGWSLDTDATDLATRHGLELFAAAVRGSHGIGHDPGRRGGVR